MHLTSAPRREVALMLASTTRKGGLNREVWAALLRVRTGPERPEDSLRELTWDSTQNCGTARERGKKAERIFPGKALTWGTAARPQNQGLSEYQARASRLRTGLSPRWRQRGRRATARARKGHHPFLDSIPYQTASRLPVATHVFLGSWAVDTRQEGHSKRSGPQRRQRHTRDGAPTAHPGDRASATAEETRRTAHLGRARHRAPGLWAAQTWGGLRTQAQPSLRLCGVPENLNLSGSDLGLL